MNDNSIKRIKLYLGSLLFDGFPTDSVVNDILSYIESEIIPPAIAARDKWWIADIEEAWNEYVIYPITINPGKSGGRTQVIFNEKPVFPEFLKGWKDRKREVTSNSE